MCGKLKTKGLTPRRILALLCLLAIIGFRINPTLLSLPFRDRRPLAAAMLLYPDERWPQFPRFLNGVRSQTRDGDSIALIFPIMNWNAGYADAYYRASYFLSGREVLPLITSDDHPHPENLRNARYVAAWRFNLQPGRGAVVWRGEGGELVRR
jgi:hypothetical protein